MLHIDYVYFFYDTTSWKQGILNEYKNSIDFYNTVDNSLCYTHQ